ncbi:MAG: hypothetical protein ACUVT5_06845 [Candidatus Bathyarchaeales archaeon]
MANLGKTTLVTPVYFSLAWTMLITYQTFTRTAVNSVVQSLDITFPMFGEWLLSRVELVEFVHVLAWVFVLTSLIPGVLIGKKRGVLIQFFCTLVLSLMALSFADFLGLMFGSQAVEHMLSYATLLNNPWIAGVYLSLPYILMLTVDLYNKKKQTKEEIIVSMESAEKTELQEQDSQTTACPLAT